MSFSIKDGANIVINSWCKVASQEKVLIISDECHVEESMALWTAAQDCGAVVTLLTIQSSCSQPGSIFDNMTDFFVQNDVIIGATGFSLITTRVVKEALSKGCRFLSLPLDSNNGQSALTFDFMRMDPEQAAQAAAGMLEHLEHAASVHVTTALGTDLVFGKRGRKPGVFNGLADRPGKIGSSSFEICIGIEETVTSGQAIVDGSLGYLGRPENPVHLTFQEGRLVRIADSKTGSLLKTYMDSFGDRGIYVAGELGIGINARSRCLGNCYIEDESAYHTFHIGMGRNLALGGVHDAAGHFDLVFHRPTIYADGVLIMKDGEAAV